MEDKQNKKATKEWLKDKAMAITAIIISVTAMLRTFL